MCNLSIIVYNIFMIYCEVPGIAQIFSETYRFNVRTHLIFACIMHYNKNPGEGTWFLTCQLKNWTGSYFLVKSIKKYTWANKISQNLGSSVLSEKLITKISNELCNVSSNNTSTTCIVIGVGSQDQEFYQLIPNFKLKTVNWSFGQEEW